MKLKSGPGLSGRFCERRERRRRSREERFLKRTGDQYGPGRTSRWQDGGSAGPR
jgi:hypothetical protein